MNNKTVTQIPPMLSPQEFAQLLGIGRRTFQTWKAAGKLPPPDLCVGKVIRWKPATIDRWLAEQSKGSRV